VLCQCSPHRLSNTTGPMKEPTPQQSQQFNSALPALPIGKPMASSPTSLSKKLIENILEHSNNSEVFGPAIIHHQSTHHCTDHRISQRAPCAPPGTDKTSNSQHNPCAPPGTEKASSHTSQHLIEISSDHPGKANVMASHHCCLCDVPI
jgi:hypothetical protein